MAPAELLERYCKASFIPEKDAAALMEFATEILAEEELTDRGGDLEKTSLEHKLALKEREVVPTQ